MDPEVLNAMMPFLTNAYGNAASVHAFGHRLMDEIDEARERIRDLWHSGAKDEITFTSGGTESNNAVIRSVVQTFPDRKHIVTSAVEHSSVERSLVELEMTGYEITRVPVNQSGRFDLDYFKSSLRADTALVTIMWANNETGILFPVDEISKMARERNILFHCDTVQAVGKVPVDLGRVPADYASVSAHKLHGPKGVGILYARKGVPFVSSMLGGAQQDGRRAGTENVAGIVGLRQACVLAKQFLENKEAGERLSRLRDRLEQGIASEIGDAIVMGREMDRLPNTSSIFFEGVEGEALLQLMSDKEIYASGGSACTAGTTEPSHVLLAMGFSERQALSAIRFSLSSLTTEEEINTVLEILPDLVDRLRKVAPM